MNDNRPVALIAEDPGHILAWLDEQLRAAGLSTILVTNGRDAIAVLDREPPVDLVVTDLQMPHATGFEVIEAWLASGGSAERVILHTAAARAMGVRMRADALGVRLLHKRDLVEGLPGALRPVLRAVEAHRAGKLK